MAIYAGSVPGAAMGFGTGFLLDLAVGGTMGVSSLVLTAVGYGVGRYREVRDPAHGLLPIPVGAAATAGWVLAFAAVSFMLDVAAPVSGLVFRDMLVTVLLNALLALPVFAVCRRILRPVLAVDPLERRRRRRAPMRDRPARPARAGDLMYLDNDSRRRRSPPSWPCAWRSSAGSRWWPFAVVFFRLWYLQVLSGDKYETEANDNHVRKIKVQAPRGEIVDREGRVLVNNRTGLAVRVTPDELPEDDGERREVYSRLGRVLGMRTRRGSSRAWTDQLKALPFSPATVKQDVPQKLVFYLFENQEDFPGVTVEQVFLREYPHRQIGAHLFGTVGEITKEQQDDTRYRGVGLGDRVGQSGIEYQYDRFLRGRNGAKAGPGRRAGQPARPAAQRASRAGPPAAPVGGPRRAARRPAAPWAEPRAPSRS